MYLGALKDRKLLLMGNQITFWAYYVFTEVRVGRVYESLKTQSKSKHRLIQTYM